ncbi:MAG: hypothetical protein ACE14M_00290 [Terriglobales bacterium]
MSTVTASQSTFGLALARVAEAMLRTLGGGEVYLRFTSPAEASDDARQLGTAAPIVTDVAMAPIVVRSLPPDKPQPGAPPFSRSARVGVLAGNQAGLRLELMFPASAVFAQMEARQVGSAQELFASALGVVVQGKMLRIENVAPEYFAGTAYLFAVTAEE